MTINTIFVVLALALALGTACLHLFAGSPEFARPLWANKNIPELARATLWMC